MFSNPAAPDGRGSTPRLPSEVWRRLEGVLERFENAWRRGEQPALEDYLKAARDPSEHRALLIELVNEDLEYRINAGEAARVEAYFQRYPELAGDRDVALDLIQREYQLRSRREPGLTLEAYGERFPQYRAELIARLTSEPPKGPAPGDTVHDQAAASAPRAAAIGASPAPFPAGAGPRYRPVRLHARGGLGEVHIAEDGELHREVALKRIESGHAQDAEVRQRFVREAEITARLEHPGVVPVHGLVHDAEGRPCYAMRFIHGESLQEALEHFHAADGPGRDPGERSLAFRQLLSRFLVVCNTIAYAHSRGVIHRDLKPANIMLGPYGETLVVDWGLAKARGISDEVAGAGAAQATPAGGVPSTMAGAVIGTPGYMSPEQAGGRKEQVGPATDIFGLGATLYGVLTGKQPFEGKDLFELLARAQEGRFPPPRQVKAGVPPALEAVCLRAMASRPADRYATATALGDDVEHWLADEPVRAYPEPWAARARRWMRRHRALVTSATAVLLASVASLAVTAAVLAGKNRELTAANNRERDAKEEARSNFAMARDAVDDCYSLTSSHPLLKGNNMQPVRQLLFDAALKYYQGFIDRRPDDPQTREELARNYYRVASINEQIASKDKALDSLQEALRIREELAERSADPSLRADLAETYSFLGLLQAGTGKKSAAEQSYDRALSVWKGLRQEDTPAVRYGLAKTLIRVGYFRYQNTDHMRALGHYEEALVLLRGLLRENPGDMEYKNNLAKALHDVGLTHRLLTGNLDEAERNYHQAIALQQELVAAYPAVSAYSQSLASSYTNLGILHFRERHNRAEALRWYTKALEIQEQLVRTDPAVTHYQQSLANAHGNLGNFYRQEKKLDKAMEHFEKCLRGYERVTRANPRDTIFQVHLAMTYANVGNVHADAGRRQEGLKCHQDGLRILEKLVADNPAEFWRRNVLGGTLGETAKLLADMGRHDEARKAYRDAVAQHATLLEALPAVGEYRDRLSGHYRGLAALQRQLQDHAAAVEATLERRKLWPRNPAELFAVARELASCIPLVGQNKADPAPREQAERRRYVELAMETLRQAVAAGYKDDAKVKQDPDLKPLHDLPEFKQLVAELEQKAKAKPAGK
jgi:serine/threonine-protein kinase